MLSNNDPFAIKARPREMALIASNLSTSCQKSSHVQTSSSCKAPFWVIDGGSVVNGTSGRYVHSPTGRQGAYGKGRGHRPECTCNQRTCCRLEPIATAVYRVSAGMSCGCVFKILLWIRVVAFFSQITRISSL